MPTHFAHLHKRRKGAGARLAADDASISQVSGDAEPTLRCKTTNSLLASVSAGEWIKDQTATNNAEKFLLKRFYRKWYAGCVSRMIENNKDLRVNMTTILSSIDISSSPSTDITDKVQLAVERTNRNKILMSNLREELHIKSTSHSAQLEYLLSEKTMLQSEISKEAHERESAVRRQDDLQSQLSEVTEEWKSEVEEVHARQQQELFVLTTERDDLLQQLQQQSETTIRSDEQQQEFSSLVRQRDDLLQQLHESQQRNNQLQVSLEGSEGHQQERDILINRVSDLEESEKKLLRCQMVANAEREDFTHEVGQLKVKITDLEKECNTQSEQLTSHKEIEELSATRSNDANQMIESLRKQLSDLQTQTLQSEEQQLRISQLKAEQAESLKRISDLELETSKLEEQQLKLEKTEEELFSLQNRDGECQVAITSLSKENEELLTRLSELDNNNQQQLIDGLKKQISTLEKETLQRLEQETNTPSEEDLLRTSQEVNVLKHTIEVLIKEKQELQHKLDIYESNEKHQIDLTDEEADQKSQRLQHLIQTLRCENESLKTDLSKSCEENGDPEQPASLKTSVAVVKDDVNINTKIKILNTNNQLSNTVLESKAALCFNLESDQMQSSHENQLRELREELLEKISICSELESEVEESKININLLTLKHDDEMNSLKSLHEELIASVVNEHESQVAEVNNVVTSLRLELDSNTIVHQLKEQLEMLTESHRKEIHEMELRHLSEITDCSNEITLLTEKLSSVPIESDLMKKQTPEESEATSDAEVCSRVTVTELQTQIETLQSNCSLSEAATRDAQRELTELKSESNQELTSLKEEIERLSTEINFLRNEKSAAASRDESSNTIEGDLLKTETKQPSDCGDAEQDSDVLKTETVVKQLPVDDEQESDENKIVNQFSTDCGIDEEKQETDEESEVSPRGVTVTELQTQIETLQSNCSLSEAATRDAQRELTELKSESNQELTSLKEEIERLSTEINFLRNEKSAAASRDESSNAIEGDLLKTETKQHSDCGDVNQFSTDCGIDEEKQETEESEAAETSPCGITVTELQTQIETLQLNCSLSEAATRDAQRELTELKSESNQELTSLKEEIERLSTEINFLRNEKSAAASRDESSNAIEGDLLKTETKQHSDCGDVNQFSTDCGIDEEKQETEESEAAETSPCGVTVTKLQTQIETLELNCSLQRELTELKSESNQELTSLKEEIERLSTEINFLRNEKARDESSNTIESDLLKTETKQPSDCGDAEQDSDVLKTETVVKQLPVDDEQESDENKIEIAVNQFSTDCGIDEEKQETEESEAAETSPCGITVTELQTQIETLQLNCSLSEAATRDAQRELTELKSESNQELTSLKEEIERLSTEINFLRNEKSAAAACDPSNVTKVTPPPQESIPPSTVEQIESLKAENSQLQSNCKLSETATQEAQSELYKLRLENFQLQSKCHNAEVTSEVEGEESVEFLRRRVEQLTSELNIFRSENPTEVVEEVNIPTKEVEQSEDFNNNTIGVTPEKEETTDDIIQPTSLLEHITELIKLTAEQDWSLDKLLNTNENSHPTTCSNCHKLEAVITSLNNEHNSADVINEIMCLQGRCRDLFTQVNHHKQVKQELNISIKTYEEELSNLTDDLSKSRCECEAALSTCDEQQKSMFVKDRQLLELEHSLRLTRQFDQPDDNDLIESFADPPAITINEENNVTPSPCRSLITSPTMLLGKSTDCSIAETEPVDYFSHSSCYKAELIRQLQAELSSKNKQISALAMVSSPPEDAPLCVQLSEEVGMLKSKLEDYNEMKERLRQEEELLKAQKDTIHRLEMNDEKIQASGSEEDEEVFEDFDPSMRYTTTTQLSSSTVHPTQRWNADQMVANTRQLHEKMQQGLFVASSHSVLWNTLLSDMNLMREKLLQIENLYNETATHSQTSEVSLLRQEILTAQAAVEDAREVFLENDSLREQLSTSQSQNKQLMEKVQLTSKLQQVKEQTLRDEIQELLQQNTRLEEKVSEEQTSQQLTVSQLMEATDQLKVLRCENEDLQTTAAENVELQAALNELRIELKSETTRWTDEILTLNRENENLQKEKEDLQSTIDKHAVRSQPTPPTEALTSQLSHNDARLRRLEEEAASLYEPLKIKYDDVTDRNQRLLTQIVSLESEVENNKQQSLDLTASNTQLTTALQEIDILKDELYQLSESIKLTEEELNKSEADNKYKTNELQQSKELITEFRSKILMLEKSLQDCDEKISSNDDLLLKLQDSRSTASALQSRVIELGNSHNDVSLENSKISKKLHQTETELSEVKNSNSDLKNSVAQLQQKILQTETDNNKLRQQTEESEETIQNYSKLEHNLEVCEAKLRETEIAKVSHLTRELDQTNVVQGELSSLQESLKYENDKLRKQVKQLREEALIDATSLERENTLLRSALKSEHQKSDISLIDEQSHIESIVRHISIDSPQRTDRCLFTDDDEDVKVENKILKTELKRVQQQCNEKLLGSNAVISELTSELCKLQSNNNKSELSGRVDSNHSNGSLQLMIKNLKERNSQLEADCSRYSAKLSDDISTMSQPDVTPSSDTKSLPPTPERLKSSNRNRNRLNKSDDNFSPTPPRKEEITSLRSRVTKFSHENETLRHEVDSVKKQLLQQRSTAERLDVVADLTKQELLFYKIQVRGIQSGTIQSQAVLRKEEEKCREKLVACEVASRRELIYRLKISELEKRITRDEERASAVESKLTSATTKSKQIRDIITRRRSSLSDE